MGILNRIDCDGCKASKYGGFASIDNSSEFCLLHNKELISDETRTIPCCECNEKDFEEDDW